MIEWITASLAYQVGKDVLARVVGARRRLTPSQVIELRSRWKPQFEQHIADNYRKKLRHDVIIRDMKHFDKYPDIDENEKGISPWFRLGLVGTYHRGILSSTGGARSLKMRMRGVTQITRRANAAT